LQPLEPAQPWRPEQQDAVSCAESSTVVLYVMHMRSLTASVEPNAQQEPQSDWSRAPEMRLAHWGHAVDELKLSGLARRKGEDRKRRGTGGGAVEVAGAAGSVASRAPTHMAPTFGATHGSADMRARM
jgi:hypothetical protein